MVTIDELSDGGKRAIDGGMDPVEWDLRVELACAFRINAHLGWEDAINTHTSMRVPGPEHHFLLNPFGLRFDELISIEYGLLAVVRRSSRLSFTEKGMNGRRLHRQIDLKGFLVCHPFAVCLRK